MPFALAAGLSGAVDSSSIIVTAGLAEVAAGTIAMGLGGYLAARTDVDHFVSERAREGRKAEAMPEEEAAEVAEILRSYGLAGDMMAPVVKSIRADKKRWGDFMMGFELGLEEPDPKRASRSAFTIALSYVVGGLVPLAPYFFIGSVHTALIGSVVVTLLALFVFGYIKGRFTTARSFRSAWQTVVVGGFDRSTPLELDHRQQSSRQPLVCWLPFVPFNGTATRKFVSGPRRACCTAPIRLSTRLDGSEVEVSVQDHGIGIAAAILPRIFEAFVQVDTSWRRTQGGMGIGLSLVKEFVELHGGRVEVRSKGVGHGSEFLVRLPVAVGAADEPTKRAEVPRGPRRRILVVDDNRDAAATLAMTLKILGHEVHTAHDGAAAVAAALEHRPIMVLMDLGMPKVDGYEAARRIRAQTSGATPFLVALTGWGAEDDRRRTQDAGFDQHLVKPVELDALKRMIADLPNKSP